MAALFKKSLLVLLLMLFSLLPLAAEIPEKPDFSGVWKADLEASDFSSYPTPVAFTRTVSQSPLHLTIDVESIDQQNRTRGGELRFSLDGEESESMLTDATVKGFALRVGTRMFVRTDRVSDGVRMLIHEIWSLSEDGKTLTIEASITTSMGDEDVYVVMRKQD
jgi:hypothetical protein